MDTSDPKQPNSPFRLFVVVRRADFQTWSMAGEGNPEQTPLKLRSNPEFTPQLNYFNFRIISPTLNFLYLSRLHGPKPGHRTQVRWLTCLTCVTSCPALTSPVVSRPATRLTSTTHHGIMPDSAHLIFCHAGRHSGHLQLLWTGKSTSRCLSLGPQLQNQRKLYPWSECFWCSFRSSFNPPS